MAAWALTCLSQVLKRANTLRLDKPVATPGGEGPLPGEGATALRCFLHGRFGAFFHFFVSLPLSLS